jgi:hypothetical protein
MRRRLTGRFALQGVRRRLTRRFALQRVRRRLTGRFALQGVRQRLTRRFALHGMRRRLTGRFALHGVRRRLTGRFALHGVRRRLTGRFALQGMRRRLTGRFALQRWDKAVRNLSVFRKPIRSIRYAFWAALILSVSAGVGDAGVLRTRFTTVLLHDLPVGYSTRLLLADGSRYSVENTGSQDLPMRFSIQKPNWIEPGQPGMPGYRPIPDRNWVAIDPVAGTVPGPGQIEVEVIVRVPQDPAFANRRYEFWLRAETAGKHAGLALLTRVRFNTVAEPSEEQRRRLEKEHEKEGGGTPPPQAEDEVPKQDEEDKEAPRTDDRVSDIGDGTL